LVGIQPTFDANTSHFFLLEENNAQAKLGGPESGQITTRTSTDDSQILLSILISF